jgi:pseudaminic acid cytidylyltransferase
MNSIAVIPARGGSKRIPRKNIRPFLGKAIISYAIENAISSQLFSEVVVTTDDDEIAKLSESLGAKCYWIRSQELSNDFAPTIDVIQDAAQKLWEKEFDYLCCIYPATPLLNTEHLISGLKLIETGLWDYVLSAIKLESNLQRSFTQGLDGELRQLFPNNELVRTQDLLPVFSDAGQFYWGKRISWEKRKPIFSSKTTLVPFQHDEVIDIDDLAHWDLAEQLYKRSRGANCEK